MPTPHATVHYKRREHRRRRCCRRDCRNGGQTTGPRARSLLAAGRLRLLLAADLLAAVLGVLLRAPARAGLVPGDAGALQAVLRLELLHLVEVVVDEAEAGAPPSAEGGLEAEQLDALRVVHLVHGRELGCEVLLGHVRHTGVD